MSFNLTQGSSDSGQVPVAKLIIEGCEQTMFVAPSDAVFARELIKFIRSSSRMDYEFLLEKLLIIHNQHKCPFVAECKEGQMDNCAYTDNCCQL